MRQSSSMTEQSVSIKSALMLKCGLIPKTLASKYFTFLLFKIKKTVDYCLNCPETWFHSTGTRMFAMYSVTSTQTLPRYPYFQKYGLTVGLHVQL